MRISSRRTVILTRRTPFYLYVSSLRPDLMAKPYVIPRIRRCYSRETIEYVSSQGCKSRPRPLESKASCCVDHQSKGDIKATSDANGRGTCHGSTKGPRANNAQAGLAVDAWTWSPNDEGPRGRHGCEPWFMRRWTVSTMANIACCPTESVNQNNNSNYAVANIDFATDASFS